MGARNTTDVFQKYVLTAAPIISGLIAVLMFMFAHPATAGILLIASALSLGTLLVVHGGIPWWGRLFLVVLLFSLFAVGLCSIAWLIPPARPGDSGPPEPSGAIRPAQPVEPEDAAVEVQAPKKWDFEEGTDGWVYQTYNDSQGIIEVAQSTDHAKSGRHSLKLTADLKGGDPNRSKGEAYVEIPVQSLQNKPITVWVHVPKEALGDPVNPSGIQVFVKDADKKWKAEYGTWWNITPAKVGNWHPVTLTPSTTPPLDGFMEQGFDPTKTRAVGVKVAIGEDSKATYRGPIYIDAVDWPP